MLGPELHQLFSPFVHLVLVEVCFYFSSEVFFDVCLGVDRKD